MKKPKQQKMYLFIRQDGGIAICLDMITPFDAVRKAQLMARKYLHDEVRCNQSEFVVQTGSNEVLTRITAIRRNGKVCCIHEPNPQFGCPMTNKSLTL